MPHHNVQEIIKPRIQPAPDATREERLTYITEQIAILKASGFRNVRPRVPVYAPDAAPDAEGWWYEDENYKDSEEYEEMIQHITTWQFDCERDETHAEKKKRLCPLGYAGGGH